MNTQKQQILLKIVQTWNLSAKPEYRRFRCANCQNHIPEAAFHHFLNMGGFLCPVHLCRDCQAQLNAKVINPKNPPANIDRNLFPFLPENLKPLVESWNQSIAQDEPILKEISCDSCGQALEKDSEGFPEGYHVWWKMDDDNLVELHFDKNCALKFGIKS